MFKTVELLNGECIRGDRYGTLDFTWGRELALWFQGRNLLELGIGMHCTITVIIPPSMRDLMGGSPRWLQFLSRYSVISSYRIIVMISHSGLFQSWIKPTYFQFWVVGSVIEIALILVHDDLCDVLRVQPLAGVQMQRIDSACLSLVNCDGDVGTMGRTNG
jgi:hypothetical protein